MKIFHLSLTNIMISLLFAPHAIAEMVTPEWSHKNPIANVVYFNRCKDHKGKDWVDDAIIDGGLYASGNIYMEYDYFLANVEKGLEFDARGSVYFLPGTDAVDVPVFEHFDEELGVGYHADGPFIDYLIMADANLDTSYFYSKWDIYVIDGAAGSEVPLPAGAWLFGSALLGLWGKQYRKHKKAAV